MDITRHRFLPKPVQKSDKKVVKNHKMGHFGPILANFGPLLGDYCLVTLNLMVNTI